jgi:hypothetical protein
MRARCWLILLVALSCATAAFAARGQDAERFEVRNAYVELVNGSWQLDVRLDLALAQAAQQAFEEGVPLTLKLEWQLAYDAIAERFVVTDGATGAHVSHATQAEALEALSRISGITIADTASLPEDQRFDMRVRATVEIGDLPAAVRMLLFWKSWSRTTEWYAWKVRP